MTLHRCCGTAGAAQNAREVIATRPWQSTETVVETAGTVVPSGVSAARTGCVCFKETTPIRHLRMVRRGMPLPPSAGSTFKVGGAGNTEKERALRVSYQALNAPPDRISRDRHIPLGTFFTFQAYRRASGSKPQYTQSST